MLALSKRQIGAFAVLATTLSLTLSACGGSDSNSTDASAAPAGGADAAVVALVPAAIAADGVITFGTELGYPPFEYTEAKVASPKNKSRPPAGENIHRSHPGEC